MSILTDNLGAPNIDCQDTVKHFWLVTSLYDNARANTPTLAARCWALAKFNSTLRRNAAEAGLITG